MKSISPKTRQVLARIVAKRTRRGLTSKRKAHRRRFARSCQRDQLRSHRKAWQRGFETKRSLRERRLRERVQPVVLEAPEQFILTRAQHRTALLRFLADLHRLVVRLAKPVRIDFHRTRRMFPDGTLLFAAQLDVVLSAAPGRVSCTRPANRIVDQLLQHLGLAAKMKRKTDLSITAENVRYWRVKSDTIVDGSHTESLIKEYEEYFSAKESAKLYEGLTEAMTNARQHAYAGSKGQRAAESRWWMFSQMRDDKLSVSFCDLGIGFRNSLLSGERWGKAAVLRAVGAIGLGKTDSRFIQAAFALGKTRTKEPHRGKGLEELKNVIESVGGRLSILSHKGYYFYASPGGEEHAVDFEDAVPGTVISWQVDLTKGTKS